MIVVAGEHGNRKHKSALIRKRIVKLRDEGLTFREICKEVDLTYFSVWTHYQNAMKDVPAEVREAHRAKQTARLDEQLHRIDMEREIVMETLAAHHVIVSNGQVVRMDGNPITDHAPILAAVEKLIKLDDQEAKLLGLYAEKKLNVSGGVKYEIVGVSPEDLK